MTLRQPRPLLTACPTAGQPDTTSPHLGAQATPRPCRQRLGYVPMLCPPLWVGLPASWKCAALASGLPLPDGSTRSPARHAVHGQNATLFPCPCLRLPALPASSKPTTPSLASAPLPQRGRQRLAKPSAARRSQSAARRVGAKIKPRTPPATRVNPTKTQFALPKPRFCARTREHKTHFHCTTQHPFSGGVLAAR